MKGLRRALAAHPVLGALFVLSSVAALAFAIRLVVFTLYWADPERRDQPVAGWMTPAYVVRSWQVPPEVVADALGLERDGQGRRITLSRIAKERGESVEALTEELTAAIAAYRAAQ